MPIYEYRCESCGHQQEFLQKVSDAPLTVCPNCGKPTFTKMLSAAGFQLKGSGWYATDFKNSGAKPSSKSSDTPKSESKPAAETKPDSKTDAKPAPSSTKPTPTSGNAS
jgi:putative FmdB family regulatory protein